MRAYDDAIDELFGAFAHCRPHGPIPYCTCGCNSKFVKDIERLPDADVRTLDRRFIDFLAGSLIWTVGDCSTLRFVLPRVLEVSWDFPTAKGLFGRIEECGFANWSQRERDAVFGFVHAKWVVWFESADVVDQGELRDMSTAIEDDWQERLHDLLASGSEASQLRLIYLLDDAFDVAPLIAWDTLSKWLHEPEIHRVFVDAMARDDLNASYSAMQATIRNRGIAEIWNEGND